MTLEDERQQLNKLRCELVTLIEDMADSRKSFEERFDKLEEESRKLHKKLNRKE